MSRILARGLRPPSEDKIGVDRDHLPGEARRALTDSELLRRARTGDRAAWRALYERHLPAVSRYAYAQLGDRHEAEDLVGETFVAAVAALATVRPEGGTVAGWLIGIARHKLGDRRRRSARDARYLAAVGPAMHDGSPADAGPPAALEAAERRDAVLAALDRLAADERAALEWKYLEGLSLRAIAGRLGRSEKAVESLLYRARQALREAMPEV